MGGGRKAFPVLFVALFAIILVLPYAVVAGPPDEREKPSVSITDDEDEESHASHQWDSYHWTKPSDGAREIILINNTTDPWRPRLAGRAQDWSEPNDINASVVSGSQDQDLREQCPMPDSYRRVRVCSFSYNNPDWLGLAVLAVNSENHIQHGKVKLDMSDQDELDADGQRHVMCHEIGHNLGLAHWNTSGNNSCMNINNVNSASYDQPATHDINQVDSQTHHHGGSGANVDVGDPLNGDVVDCVASVCFEVTSAHSSGSLRMITVRMFLRPLNLQWHR